MTSLKYCFLILITLQMLMRLDRKMVNIMDHENKEVVERFPIHLVREPTAFTSSDPKVGFIIINFGVGFISVKNCIFKSHP